MSGPSDPPPVVRPGLTSDLASRYAAIGCANLRRQTPHELERRTWAIGLSPEDVHPAFHGCFDWHSAVHTAWMLARLLNADVELADESLVRQTLGDLLSRERLAGELRQLSQPGWEDFECPYGLAWLLALDAEAGDIDGLPDLAALAAARLIAWLRERRGPLRTGQHSQSAFALGLLHDWARRRAGAVEVATATDFILRDHFSAVAAELPDEPAVHDFLPLRLAEADCVRRVLPPGDFAGWLDGFGGMLAELRAEAPVVCRDPADGLLVHWDGLNLARAFFLRGIASVLPAGDARRPVFLAAEVAHGEAGLAAIDPRHYSGSHWLCSFAVYWLTAANVSETPDSERGRSASADAGL